MARKQILKLEHNGLQEETKETQEIGEPETKEEVLVSTLVSPQHRSVAVPKVEVSFGNMITSAHQLYSKSLLVTDTKKNLAEEQVVVAAGPNCVYKTGDWVRLNFDMFPKKAKPGAHDVGTIYDVIVPAIRIGQTDYLYVSDRHVMFKLIR